MRLLKWKYFAFSTVLLLAGFSQSQQPASLVSYNLKVRIEPAQGIVAVRGTLEVPPALVQDNRLRFNLHETFVVRKLLVDGRGAKFSSQPAEFSPVMPASKVVSVELPPQKSARNRRVEIEYLGHLKELGEFGSAPDQKASLDDQVNSRMVELASYSSWYPQFAWGQLLNSTLELSLPQGWKTICSGKKVEERSRCRRSITRWSSEKDADIVVLASRDYRRRDVAQSGVPIEIYDTRMPTEFIDRESGQIAGVIRMLSGRLGETNIPNGVVKHVYSPKRKGQGMAGFARPGLIVTSEGITLDSLAADPNFTLFQGIAHEIAHFWWNFGTGQGDWVNEAFSEYYSAVAVQQLVSADAFAQTMQRYRTSVRGLPAEAPSLSRVPFAGGDVNWIIRYQKGALMLNDFRRELGDEKFFAASRDFFQTYRGRPAGTAEFRAFWKERLGERASLVDDWLDASGHLMPTHGL